MNDLATPLTLSAAFLAGLAGSGHCFGMCGGFAGALGLRARAVAATRAGALLHSSVYHVGRLGGYSLAGALIGAFGTALYAALDLARLSMALRIASGVLLIAMGLRLALSVNLLGWLERFGVHVWRRMQPLMQHAGRGSGPARSLLLGFLWGWLPCGLVYSMLLVAALSGNALQGAAIMLSFGAGTLPALLAGTILVSQVRTWSQQPRVRVANGVLLVILGAWIGLNAAGMNAHAGHAAAAAVPAVEHAQHQH